MQNAWPTSIKQIMVPVDMRHAEASERAISAASWFARQMGASISILTVANPLGVAFSDMPEDRKPDFEAFVSEMSRTQGYEIKALFRSHESVNHAIEQVIKDEAIDFVVMATHSPRLTDHLFGSHASQTALHNNCSVLILRSE